MVDPEELASRCELTKGLFHKWKETHFSIATLIDMLDCLAPI